MLKLTSLGLLRLRKQYLTLLASTNLLFSLLGFILVGISFSETGVVSLVGVFILIGVAILSVTWLMLLRSNRVDISAYGVLLTLTGAYYFATASSIALVGSVILITAALLLRRTFYYTAIVVVFLRVLIELNTQLGAPLLDYNNLINLLLISMLFGFLSGVVRTIAVSSQTTAEASNHIATAMDAATTTGRVIGQQVEALEMMRLATNAIRDRFGYYHVQVFILNESGDQAVLRASTGDIGYQLLARRHQLTVGSQSVVGQAVLRGTSVLVKDTAREVVYFRNELLPNTRAEFTIPLKDGNTVVGALDIQSTVPESFTDVDQRALEIIAESLALGLRDARISAQQTHTSEENTRIVGELTAALRENDRLNRELTQATWSEYLSQRTTITGITLQGEDLVPEANWSPDLERASNEGETITEGGMVAVPVMLRGEVIGAIEIDPGQSTQAETVEIAQAVAQRLAVSLESARLYEETRQSAYQEQQINEIAARFGTTASIDDLLRITLVELGETLGAHSGAIRLGRLNNGASGS